MSLKRTIIFKLKYSLFSNIIFQKLLVHDIRLHEGIFNSLEHWLAFDKNYLLNTNGESIIWNSIGVFYVHKLICYGR